MLIASLGSAGKIIRFLSLASPPAPKTRKICVKKYKTKVLLVTTYRLVTLINYIFLAHNTIVIYKFYHYSM